MGPRILIKLKNVYMQACAFDPSYMHAHVHACAYVVYMYTRRQEYIDRSINIKLKEII